MIRKKKNLPEIQRFLPNLCKKETLDSIIHHYNKDTPFIQDLIKLRKRLYG